MHSQYDLPKPISISVFSDEVMLHIFNFLAADPLAYAGSVCKRWNVLAKDNQLWKNLLIQDFAEITHVFENELSSDKANEHSKSERYYKNIYLREHFIRDHTLEMIQTGYTPNIGPMWGKDPYRRHYQFMLNRHFFPQNPSDKNKPRYLYNLHLVNNAKLRVKMNLQDKFNLSMRTGYLEAFEYLTMLVEEEYKASIATNTQKEGFLWGKLSKLGSKTKPTVKEFINQRYFKDGQTLLNIAAFYGHLHLVKKLVELGADINMTNKDGKTALHCAVQNRQQAVFNWLLENGANYQTQASNGETILYFFVKRREYDLARQLIDNIDPEARSSFINTAKINGESPLHIAAGKGYLELVSLLLKEGANKDSTCTYYYNNVHPSWDESGITPLHLAAEAGHLAVVEYLLAAGADMNKKTSEQESPMYVAFRGRHNEIVKCLLRAGADFSDVSWRISLKYKMSHGSTKVHERLHAFTALIKEVMQEQREIIGAQQQIIKAQNKQIEDLQSSPHAADSSHSSRPLLQGIIRPSTHNNSQNNSTPPQHTETNEKRTTSTVKPRSHSH